MNVITRFAPSPTGYLHAGNYRTALYAYIFAKKNGGKFLLRIEDTDKERSKKEYEDNIIESLEWLGLEYDDFYRQSERTETYRSYIQKLIDSGKAYVSKENSADHPILASKNEFREQVIRFKNPNKKVEFTDLLRGKIEFDTTELGDFIIAKSIDEPVFHLVVVVDDSESGVTHIIRGEDHISNTPRHILIAEALGLPIPNYAHIPLLLAPDRSKLSKRNGAVPITEYRKKGYLPAAVLNYLALLGWHPKDDKEILSVSEIVEQFTLERVQKSGAIFDEEKLRWFNRQYITALSEAEFIDRAATFMPEWLSKNSPGFSELLALLRDKISTFGEIESLFASNGELGFINKLPDYKPALLLWKKNPDNQSARGHLEEIKRSISDLSESEFKPSAIKDKLWSYAEKCGKGDVLWPMRVALTGQEKSPDPFIAAAILGKTECLKRIAVAIHNLE